MEGNQHHLVGTVWQSIEQKQIKWYHNRENHLYNVNGQLFTMAQANSLASLTPVQKDKNNSKAVVPAL